MKATLIIPRPPVQVAGQIVQSETVYRWPIRWTDHHPSSHHGLGVLLDGKNEVLDGHMFTWLRRQVGARIQCDDPARVCGALGLPAGSEGIGR